MAMKKADQAAPNSEQLADLEGNNTGHEIVRADTASMVLGGMDGDVGDVDLRLPYMQISHSQGKLEAFRKGSIVIGTDNLIANPGEKLLVTFLAARVYWKEYVSGDHYDPAVVPRTFSTKEEVLAAGGTVAWANGQAPTFKLALATKAIVKQPEGVVCGLFGVRIGDADYAPVLWNMDKTACSRVAPTLKSDMAFSLRKRGLHSGIYEVFTQSVKFASGFSSFVPNAKLVGYHTDAEIAQILELFNPEGQTGNVDISGEQL